MGLTSEQQRRLNHLLRAYRHDEEQLGPHHSFYPIAGDHGLCTLREIHRHVLVPELEPAAIVGRYLSGLARHIPMAPDPYWRQRYLRFAAEDIAMLHQIHTARARARAAADRIKAVLQRWTSLIRADPAIPKVQRDALLRWIREACRRRKQ
ncbi:MAG: hypothetical protein HKL96_11155 [Phycisphaerales bacterium]|nr:hypothetical protein [Phycisphaerales bacterium]